MDEKHINNEKIPKISVYKSSYMRGNVHKNPFKIFNPKIIGSNKVEKPPKETSYFPKHSHKYNWLFRPHSLHISTPFLKALKRKADKHFYSPDIKNKK